MDNSNVTLRNYAQKQNAKITINQNQQLKMQHSVTPHTVLGIPIKESCYYGNDNPGTT